MNFTNQIRGFFSSQSSRQARRRERNMRFTPGAESLEGRQLLAQIGLLTIDLQAKVPIAIVSEISFKTPDRAGTIRLVSGKTTIAEMTATIDGYTTQFVHPFDGGGVILQNGPATLEVHGNPVGDSFFVDEALISGIDMWGRGHFTDNSSWSFASAQLPFSVRPVSTAMIPSTTVDKPVQQSVATVSAFFSGPSEITVNEVATYNAVIRNTGNGAAKNVKVEYNTPQGFALMSAVWADFVIQGNVITGSIPLLEPGQERLLTFTFRPVKKVSASHGVTIWAENINPLASNTISTMVS